MPRDAKPSLRKRRGIWYARVPVAGGGRREVSLRTGDKREAQAKLRDVALVAAGEVPPGLLTLAAYAATWLPERTEQIRSAADEERWLRLHVLSRIGDRVIGELTPPDVAAWVRSLRDAGLAARSVRNAHGVLVALLGHAKFHSVILSNPAKDLPRGMLPTIGRSKRPAYRVHEVSTLVYDSRIDWSRRIVYAIAAFTGCRPGEACGRRWRDLEAREPMRALRITTQWNDAPLKGSRDEDNAERLVPVHPELDRILDEWRRIGWEKCHGRLPRADDWIVPGDIAGTVPLTRHQVTKAHARDLARVGLELDAGAGLHSLRRSFVTMARAAGADAADIAEVTHRPKGNILEDAYTRRSWETLCSVVARIELRRDEGAEVIRLPLAAAGSGGYPGGSETEVSETTTEKGGGSGCPSVSMRETLAFPAIRAVRGPSESPAFTEVSESRPQSGGQPPRDSVLVLLGVLRVV